MPDLITKISSMATDIEVLKIGQEYLKSETSEIKRLLKEHADEEREMWATKADKWVERAIIVALTGIVGASAWLVWSKVTTII